MSQEHPWYHLQDVSSGPGADFWFFIKNDEASQSTRGGSNPEPEPEPEPLHGFRRQPILYKLFVSRKQMFVRVCEICDTS